MSGVADGNGMHGFSAGDIEAKAEELLTSPAGCAFLVVLQTSGISASDAVRPSVSLHAAHIALDELSIWRPDFREIMKYALFNGRKLKELARTLLEQPGADWLFAPVCRDAQIWVSRRRHKPAHVKLDPPNAPLISWERSCNKSEAGMYTCTSFAGETALFTALDLREVQGANDLSIAFEFPVNVWRLRVNESARVYEINSAADWHRLSADYPAKSIRDASDPACCDAEGWNLYPLTTLPGSADERKFAVDMDRWLTPDWAAVAEEWDAAHLTLGGAADRRKGAGCVCGRLDDAQVLGYRADYVASLGVR